MLQIYLSKIILTKSDQTIAQLSQTSNSGLRKNSSLDRLRNRFRRKRSKRRRIMMKTKRYSSKSNYLISSSQTGMKKEKTDKHKNSQLISAIRVEKVTQL